MNVSQLKGLAAVCIWLASLTGGLLPFWLKRHAAQASRKAAAHDAADAAAASSTEVSAAATTGHQHHHIHNHYDDHHDSDSDEVPSPSDTGFRSGRQERRVQGTRGGYGSTASRRGSHAHAHGQPHKQHGCCHLDVDRFLSFGNMLGAGIFLGGGLMHLLPESAEGIEKLQDAWSLGFLDHYPIAYFLAAIGFFTILLVEEATIAITQRRNRSKAKKAEQQAALQHAQERTVSPGPGGSLTTEVESSPAAPAPARNLSRNLVQGLTPRVALVPDRTHTHVRTRRGGEEVVEECSESSDGSSGESEPGPIQQFLDAAYNSPSPFPSLAERERARRVHHRCGVGPTVEMSDSEASEAGTLSGDEVYTAGASSRAAAARNASVLRSDDLGQQLASSTLKQPLLDASAEVDPDMPPLMGITKVRVEPASLATPERKERRKKKRPNRLLKSTPILSRDAHAHDAPSKDIEAGHDHGHGHGGGDHSHVEITGDTSYIVAYLLVLALSFHSIFEGIALGTQEKTAATISIFIAIIAHSPLAGFALGVSLVKSRAAPRMALSCLFLFTIMTPLGTMLGLLLSVTLQGSTLTLVSCCFQAFSAGTFFFVAFEEIIPKELALPKDKPLKLALCVLGFLAMAAIKIFDNDDSDN